MNYKNLNEAEKDKLVKQYEPLINKISYQFFEKVQCDWEDLKSYAYEGFALAIQKYDDTRSTMNFTQYAAFAIRNNILTSLDNELRTVKLSEYARRTNTENGVCSFNMISLDRSSHDDEENKSRKIVLSTSVKDGFSNGDVFEYLYSRIEDEFSYRDCEMFYRTFGLKNFEVTKNKDIAKLYNISEGSSCQKVMKIIKWIRKDTELCEQLSELLNN